VSYELNSEIHEHLLVTITKEMKMKYENGNINLDIHEIALLNMISGSEPQQSNGILMFLYGIESVKDGAHQILWTAAEKGDQDFLDNEKKFRETVDFTVMVCNKFTARALRLAREAGAEVDFF